MSFPHHDQFWTDTAEFLKAQLQPNDQILAPDQFWWLFGSIYRYLNTTLDSDCIYEWVVIHKGELHKISKAFLVKLPQRMKPVFANEVFVIWSLNKNLEVISSTSDHLKAFFDQVSALNRENHGITNTINSEPILPESGKITSFAQLSDVQIKEFMDKFWSQGGYVYETLRDQTYYAEIDRYIAEFVSNDNAKTILDLCCGTGRLSKIISQSQQIIGIDISEVAIEIAKVNHRNQKEFEFKVMDVHNLDFADHTFDTVMFIDAIEHVKNAKQVISEISRVIKLNGKFLLTVANKNSLNQIINRKLGYPEFVTNYQHIQEFSYQEIQALLNEHNFTINKTAGIFLYPYWGIPGIDEVVREVTDNDAELVEIMRVLGERAGKEYAYAFVVQATKN